MELTALALLPGCGLVMVGSLSLVLVHVIRTGGLDRNSYFGLRTPTTMATDETWVAGHVAALPVLQWLGVVPILLGVSPFVVRLLLGGPQFERRSGLVTMFVRAHRAAGAYLVEHFDDDQLQEGSPGRDGGA